MDIKINIVSRIILITILVVVVGKILGQFLGAHLTGKKKKKKTPDFDALVRQKENILRSQEGLGPKASTTKKTEKQYESKIEEQISSEMMRSSTKDERKSEITKMLALFDAARWGEGKAFEDVRHKLAALYKFDFKSNKVARSLNFLKKNNIFLTLNRTELINYDEMVQIIGADLFFNEMLEEIKGNGSDLLLFFARQSKTDLDSTLKASQLVLGEHFGERITISEVLKEDVKIRPNDPRDYLFEEKRRKIVDTTNLCKKIVDMSLIIKALSPIERPDRKDLKASLKIFGATEHTSFDAITKKYKKLASQLHPDRLSGMGLDQSLEKLATENFSVMQEAYNTIKKAMK